MSGLFQTKPKKNEGVVKRVKTCYCHTCDKNLHSLGVATHRAAHKRRKENCEITFTNGETYKYDFKSFWAEL